MKIKKALQLLSFVLVLIAHPLAVAQCFQEISAGFSNHSIAKKNDHTIYTWGSNTDSELGDGTNINRNVLTAISMDQNWQTITAGSYHTLAIKTDGTLWAWGRNYLGQLGDGTNVLKNSPTPIGTATNWDKICAGNEHTIALKTDGSLWAWGQNSSRQLGNGTFTNNYVPTQIGSAYTWSKISAGYQYTLALKTDGTLWGWGDNSHGQLGDGTQSNRAVPTKIGLLTNWSAIATGWYHTLTIKTDGSLWSWGFNEYGQLGYTTSSYLGTMFQTQLGTATNWSKISGGYGHSLALKTDGTLWAWGFNVFGQLGDGTNTNKNIPIQVGTANDWVAISAGMYHSIALKADGTLWSWGLNDKGQLGDGTNVNKNTPTALVCPISLSVASTTIEKLQIYPNPVGAVLHIESVDAIHSIALFDCNGRTIHIEAMTDKNKTSVLVENLQKGIYFLKISTDSGTVIKKIVKE